LKRHTEQVSIIAGAVRGWAKLPRGSDPCVNVHGYSRSHTGAVLNFTSVSPLVPCDIPELLDQFRRPAKARSFGVDGDEVVLLNFLECYVIGLKQCESSISYEYPLAVSMWNLGIFNLKIDFFLENVSCLFAILTLLLAVDFLVSTKGNNFYTFTRVFIF